MFIQSHSLQGLQVNTGMLEEMGQHFCEGLNKLARRFEATGTAHRHLFNHANTAGTTSTGGAQEAGGSGGAARFLPTPAMEEEEDMEEELL